MAQVMVRSATDYSYDLALLEATRERAAAQLALEIVRVEHHAAGSRTARPTEV